MTSAITTTGLISVSNRNIVKPVRAISKIYLDTNQSNAAFEKPHTERAQSHNSASSSSSNYSPFFAAHVLVEAGLDGKHNNLMAGNRAYAKKAIFTQSLIAIA